MNNMLPRTVATSSGSVGIQLVPKPYFETQGIRILDESADSVIYSSPCILQGKGSFVRRFSFLTFVMTKRLHVQIELFDNSTFASHSKRGKNGRQRQEDWRQFLSQHFSAANPTARYDTEHFADFYIQKTWNAVVGGYDYDLYDAGTYWKLIKTRTGIAQGLPSSNSAYSKHRRREVRQAFLAVHFPPSHGDAYGEVPYGDFVIIKHWHGDRKRYVYDLFTRQSYEKYRGVRNGGGLSEKLKGKYYMPSTGGRQKYKSKPIPLSKLKTYGERKSSREVV